jgi:hypothetical protein
MATDAFKDAEMKMNGHIMAAEVLLAEAQKIGESIRRTDVVESLKTSRTWALTARRDLLEPPRRG